MHCAGQAASWERRAEFVRALCGWCGCGAAGAAGRVKSLLESLTWARGKHAWTVLRVGDACVTAARQWQTRFYTSSSDSYINSPIHDRLALDTFSVLDIYCDICIDACIECEQAILVESLNEICYRRYRLRFWM